MSHASLTERIASFLEGAPHAVVGASRNRAKYGNMVLRAYVQRGMPVYPVNPTANEVEGLKAYPDLTALPERVHGVSIITPPTVTEQVVEEAHKLGIRHIWMQPGAESPKSIKRAAELGLSVIAGDACILVVLGHHA